MILASGNLFCPSAGMQETQVWSLGKEDTLEKGMATLSNILAWEIPWTEEPGGLQSTGSQRVRHDWVTNTFIFTSAGRAVSSNTDKLQNKVEAL